MEWVNGCVFGMLNVVIFVMDGRSRNVTDY
jgi:hypothetical protein